MSKMSNSVGKTSKTTKVIKLEKSNKHKASLWKIFSITAKIGGTAIGGGYVMLPIIKREFVDKHSFISSDEFSAMLVMAQSLPGPIAVNISTIVGYKLRKLPGAISAVSGAIFIPTLIILMVSIFLENFQSISEPFLRGMRAPLFAVFVITVIKMWKNSIKSKEDLTIFFLAFVLLTFLKFNPVALVLLAIFYIMLRNAIINLKKKGKRKK